jgi:hypothetical protein
MNPSQMGGLGSGPLPSCFIGNGQMVLENIIGSGTIFRFFSSGSQYALVQQIATDIHTIPASSVGSGNSVVDTTVAGLANSTIIATNAITGALSDLGEAYLHAVAVVANATYNAIVNPIEAIVAGDASAVGTNLGVLAGNTLQAAADVGNSFANGDIAGGLGHMQELGGQLAATTLAAVLAVPEALAAGTISSYTSGSAAGVVNNLGTQANNLATAANNLENADNAADALAGTGAVIAGGFGLVGAAVAATGAIISSGVVSSFNTVGTGDPNAAFNNLDTQSSVISAQAATLQNAADSGNVGATLQATAIIVAESVALVTSAIVAPLASAAAAVSTYVQDIAHNPTQAVIASTTSVVNSANQAQAGFNSGNANQAVTGAANVLGDSLNVAATTIVAGFVELGNNFVPGITSIVEDIAGFFGGFHHINTSEENDREAKNAYLARQRAAWVADQERMNSANAAATAAAGVQETAQQTALTAVNTAWSLQGQAAYDLNYAKVLAMTDTTALQTAYETSRTITDAAIKAYLDLNGNGITDIMNKWTYYEIEKITAANTDAGWVIALSVNYADTGNLTTYAFNRASGNWSASKIYKSLDSSGTSDYQNALVIYDGSLNSTRPYP